MAVALLAIGAFVVRRRAGEPAVKVALAALTASVALVLAALNTLRSSTLYARPSALPELSGLRAGSYLIGIHSGDGTLLALRLEQLRSSPPVRDTQSGLAPGEVRRHQALGAGVDSAVTAL